MSSIDGRLVRSLRCLLTRPGALTVAYAEGAIRVVASLGLGVAVAIIAIDYRFGLFLFTLYVT